MNSKRADGSPSRERSWKELEAPVAQGSVVAVGPPPSCCRGRRAPAGSALLALACGPLPHADSLSVGSPRGRLPRAVRACSRSAGGIALPARPTSVVPFGPLLGSSTCEGDAPVLGLQRRVFVWAKRAATRLTLDLIRLYQLMLSPLLGPSCRFEPSCSRYTATCVQRLGVARGLWLGARRIGRCHPFSEGGYDPPPGEEL